MRRVTSPRTRGAPRCIISVLEHQDGSETPLSKRPTIDTANRFAFVFLGGAYLPGHELGPARCHQPEPVGEPDRIGEAVGDVVDALGADRVGVVRGVSGVVSGVSGVVKGTSRVAQRPSPGGRSSWSRSATRCPPCRFEDMHRSQHQIASTDQHPTKYIYIYIKSPHKKITRQEHGPRRARKRGNKGGEGIGETLPHSAGAFFRTIAVTFSARVSTTSWYL